MVKKFKKTEDGYVLVIDPTILQRLNIDPEKNLDISTDGQCLVVKQMPSRSKGEGTKQKDCSKPKFPSRRKSPTQGKGFGFPKKQPW